MKETQLKTKDIPVIKAKLLKKQKNLCLVCKRDLTTLPTRDVCLDHNHSTWMVRGVLCRQCNVLEAKYFRAFIRTGARNQGVDYKELLKGLIKFQKVKDTTYRYPPKSKKRRKKK